MPLSDRNGAAVRVLIAEDNAVDRTILSSVVRKFGYEPVAVCDGLEAWDCLEKPDAPQIALLDWMMPGLDGPELCRRLRARERADALYLLLVTGKNNREDIVAGLESGADDFITKPWNTAELRARMNVGRRMVELQNRLRENVSELRVALADTRRLMEEQQLNIDLARKLLSLANTGAPAWIGLNDDLTLHVAFESLSCARAGGDHFWARTLPTGNGRGPRTTIGIRDQSGHEVNCILRSIASDLIHMGTLDGGVALERQIAIVNERLCSSGMFAEDDFVTAMTLELDHATLRLRYVSCGHPPMLLIRGDEVKPLPENAGAGRNVPLGSLPGWSFEAGECLLQPGDRILLYTDGLGELGPASRSSLTNEEIFELVASLVRQEPGIPVRRLVKRLLQTAAENPDIVPALASLRDDVTLLGLEIEEDGCGQEEILYLSGTAAIDSAVKQLTGTVLACWQAEPALSSLRQFLDEALTNAWLHGNKQNPHLPVRVKWRRHNGYALQVEDAGAGFDLKRVIDPCSYVGLTREHGRGLFIIKNTCDWVEWKKGGSRLAARLACPGFAQDKNVLSDRTPAGMGANPARLGAPSPC